MHHLPTDLEKIALLQNYIAALKTQFGTESFTEHTFRHALITFIEGLNPNVIAQNETQRIANVGMPDITIMDRSNNDVKLGWIECKDLNVDLSFKKNQNQLSRYLSAFDNFIYTNNLQFDFYRTGELVDSVKLGSIHKDKIIREESTLLTNNHEKLVKLLVDFMQFQGQTIKSPLQLARSMAGKAQLIAMAIEKILGDKNEQEILKEQFDTFKKDLIHDLDIKQFADMYAQTVVYGLFVARLHDSSLEGFSRIEAEKLIPKSNPFLKWLFKQIASDDEFDDRINYIIDDLINIFTRVNVADILQGYGNDHDPIIHFYEDFLAIYNSETRKKRGVYYTPKPVVNFIIRNIDYLLKKEFSLGQGFADTSKITNSEGKQLHRVQVLDPAIGTGTFINELIIYLHAHYFTNMTGIRSEYVQTDLLPRLFGFELMMASYAMCHLRIGLTLQSTGYDREDSRIGVYLTNSLEQANEGSNGIFAKQLAIESKMANQVKSTQPIMIIMGNPPYSALSGNMGERAAQQIEVYKYIDGKHFGEKKHRLHDDYVKFIRLAESLIEKNESGIIGYINPHGFLDNPTFRGMRWHLLSTFDKIYIIDLHGNSKKKETSPNGSKDENVFDIQQGVAITFFVKTGNKKEGQLAEVYHTDIYGSRADKFSTLDKSMIDTISWTQVLYNEPNYFFTPKSDIGRETYESYVSIADIMHHNVSGIVTSRDNFIIDIDKNMLQKKVYDFCDKKLSDADFQLKYHLSENYQRKLGEQRMKSPQVDMKKFLRITYRPFDERRIYYQDNLVFRMRFNIMQNFIKADNIGLIIGRQGHVTGNMERGLITIVENISDFNLFYRGGGLNFPLYLYNTGIDGKIEKMININPLIIKQFEKTLELYFMKSEESEKSKIKENVQFTEKHILDYIYAILHHRGYRERYSEFLKIDFPRIPIISEKKIFRKLCNYGQKLRNLHLMVEVVIEGISYPISGDNIVEKISWESGKVWINNTQYFEGVSRNAREFYIGGYQPAQKWLKDRKGSNLSAQDIMHYMKICNVLEKTDEVMGELEEVDVFNF